MIECEVKIVNDKSVFININLSSFSKWSKTWIYNWFNKIVKHCSCFNYRLNWQFTDHWFFQSNIMKFILYDKWLIEWWMILTIFFWHKSHNTKEKRTTKWYIQQASLTRQSCFKSIASAILQPKGCKIGFSFCCFVRVMVAFLKRDVRQKFLTFWFFV